MAYDPVRQHVVLFGGNALPAQSLKDMWEWTGVVWSPLAVSAGLSAREEAGMASDPFHRQVVLAGGRSNGVPETDSWSWDGTSWMNRGATVFDGGKVGPALGGVPDGGLLLFGGITNGIPSAETWGWDGTTWTDLATAAGGPLPRAYAAMANDSTGATLLFGGFDGGSAMGDTWLWDPIFQAWTGITPTRALTPRWGHGMAYDSSRQRTVAFGGTGAYGSLNDTSDWDGVAWIATPGLTGGEIPEPRSHFGMAFDEFRQVMVLFGGLFDDGGVTNDLWELRPGAFPDGGLPDAGPHRAST